MHTNRNLIWMFFDLENIFAHREIPPLIQAVRSTNPTSSIRLTGACSSEKMYTMDAAIKQTLISEYKMALLDSGIVAPDAADNVLKREMMKASEDYVGKEDSLIICIISNDHGFHNTIRQIRNKGFSKFAVIGKTDQLSKIYIRDPDIQIWSWDLLQKGHLSFFNEEDQERSIYKRDKAIAYKKKSLDNIVCKDFLYGRCPDESLCKYEHRCICLRDVCPILVHTKKRCHVKSCSKLHILVCRDFIKGRCTRQDCSFPHISK
jgi:hypothetical protein